MISLVVPAYNEGKRIRENLIIISEELRKAGLDYEILPVNDGSTDDTKERIEEAASSDPRIKPVSYEKNRGKGGAIKEGVMRAEGEVIGFLDADLDLSPDHVVNFYREMESSSCDVVIGSKMHRESKLDYPPVRKLFSFGYFVFLKILFGLKTKDTQTGVKLYRGDLIRDIVPRLKVNGYAFDIEILALCAAKGAVIKEMPVTVGYTRTESLGRIRFKDIWKMFTDTWRIWWDLRVKKNYGL
ncbi:MAG: glycosyltransferase [Clostridiales bacterium]|nr:glycosyltransferase [Clostridiales bacterium]